MRLDDPRIVAGQLLGMTPSESLRLIKISSTPIHLTRAGFRLVANRHGILPRFSTEPEPPEFELGGEA